MDNNDLQLLMNDQKFVKFLKYIEKISGVYFSNSQANPYHEGRRSIGLDVRYLLQNLANKNKLDFPQFGIFFEGEK